MVSLPEVTLNFGRALQDLRPFRDTVGKLFVALMDFDTLCTGEVFFVL